MGMVTISISTSRTPLGYSSSFSTSRSSVKKPFIVAFKSNKSDDNTAVATRPSPKQGCSHLEDGKSRQKKRKNTRTPSRKGVLTDEVPPGTLEMDYADAAAKLENIFKLVPDVGMDGKDDGLAKDLMNVKRVVQSRRKMSRRLSLDKRINLKKNKPGESASSVQKMNTDETEEEKIERLVRDYSASTDLVSLDWKKMKIPPVLPSSEHAWLFRLMQPMKAILRVKDTLQKDLVREPNERELANAVNMPLAELRKQLQIARAARNKLIKHNLRLVLFVINKYFQDFANSSRFQDLCQAGVKGLITAIDRFEPTRRFRLSTYGLFWIRHTIIRSMTVSSFTRVPFGLESVRFEIQRAKHELLNELQRMPTEEEILQKSGISPERYREVMRASRPVYSLNSRHAVTQEEFIDGIADVDSVNGDNRRQPAHLRLALDDVLDSLKPKESLVVRQRYGLDGKGDRTLSEIAGNLNLSREMVRKHEMKALMKLKHPTRVDYLQRHVV